MKKTTKIFIVTASLVAFLAAVIVGMILYARMDSQSIDEVTMEDAQIIVDDALDKLYDGSSLDTPHYIVNQTSVTVKEIEYGENKTLLLTCDVTSLKVKDTVLNHIDEILTYSKTKLIDEALIKRDWNQLTSSHIRPKVDDYLCILLEDAERVEHTMTLEFYQMRDDSYALYTSEDTINLLFGDIADVKSELRAVKNVTIEGEEIKLETNMRNGILGSIDLHYDTERPDNAIWYVRLWNNFVNDFHRNFIVDARWHYLTDGLWMTAKITFFAVLIGVVLGFLVAVIRCTHDKIGKLKILNAISKVYLTVIRGTPVLVQLMIIFFVIFMPLGINKVIAAILCFGLNSGAYVAEIVRGGIMSIDEGQFEAGRSLGFNYTKTMWYIILPQAFKSVLPALANEFIVLLKETSVASYIGINDLARGGDIIRGVTFSAFMPLIAVALIYLVIVMGLTKLVALLERRLRKSDRG